MKRHTILIHFRYALGDTVVCTALVRDLAQAYPEYRIMVHTNFTPVWYHNPYIVPLNYNHQPKPQVIHLAYQDGLGEVKAGRDIHFLAWLYEDLYRQTGLRVDIRAPRGDLHFAPDEAQRRLVKGRYWVIVSGGKLDITVKQWNVGKYQEVVDALAREGIPCVQAGATHQNNYHPPLNNVLDMIGRTDNVRDLFGLIDKADGVIAGVTGFMHIAAALHKPCVVLAGGRETPVWEWYTPTLGGFGAASPLVTIPHRFLHNIGQIQCTGARGCWRTKTVPIDAMDLHKSSHLCLDPVRHLDHPVPLCMDIIDSQTAIDAVLSYYKDGTLSPIPVQEPLTFQDEPLAPVRLQQIHQKEVPSSFHLPPAMRPASADTPARHVGAIDHVTLGGKVTVCMICYGGYPDLTKRCLDSIISSVDFSRIDLRVGTNEVCEATLDYLQKAPLSVLQVNEKNRFKYPVLHDLLHDRQRPIETKYVVYFDDDSYVVDPQWLDRLCECIVANHPHGGRLYGIKFFHDLTIYRQKLGMAPLHWFKKATWWRHRDLFVRGQEGLQAPNGSGWPFVAGGFWALSTDLIRAADIPDFRLLNNGGDCCIGCQVHQAGFKIVDFNRGKCHVFSSGAPRRGVTHAFPWAVGLAQNQPAGIM